MRKIREYDVMESVSQKLKSLRELAQPRMSVRGMADALGVPHSTYATYENPAKFKKQILPLPLAQKIAAILEERGVNKNKVLELAGIPSELRSYLTSATENNGNDDWLTVSGAVVAGIWKEQADWPLAEQYDVRFGPSEYSKEKRFAVNMVGLSMNKTIPPGSDLECLWVKYSPIPPAPGDLVIVERRNHNLVEMSCKRLAFANGNYLLACESTEPEFQTPINIGPLGPDSFSGDEVRIVGIVLSAKLDLAPKGLGGRRYRG